MSKSKYREDADAADEARQEKILEQLRLAGRMPTPPPGHIHESEKQRRKKNRKNERNRLRVLARNHNQGLDDEGY